MEYDLSIEKTSPERVTESWYFNVQFPAETFYILRGALIKIKCGYRTLFISLDVESETPS